MTDFLPAYPHGPIVELFPDVFFVTGRWRFAPGVWIPRNMTILRTGDELAILNSVRLGPEGEAELGRLGRVTKLLRIGAHHGADDPYYIDRFQPTLLAPPGTKHKGGLTTDVELRSDTTPVPGMRVLPFEKARTPETAILLEREGGILITTDSYQNWTSFDGCSLLGRVVSKALGFGPAVIGGPWAKAAGPGVRADFDRLEGIPFRHLLSGHGAPLRDAAKEGLRTAIARRFGS